MLSLTYSLTLSTSIVSKCLLSMGFITAWAVAANAPKPANVYKAEL